MTRLFAFEVWSPSGFAFHDTNKSIKNFVMKNKVFVYQNNKTE